MQDVDLSIKTNGYFVENTVCRHVWRKKSLKIEMGGSSGDFGGGGAVASYGRLRTGLDDAGYRDVLPLEGLPLVTTLFDDLTKTTQSLEQAVKQYSYYKQIAEELQAGVSPFKAQNVRLIRENSHLRVALYKAQETADERDGKNKKRIEELEEEKEDLKLLVGHLSERLGKFDRDLINKRLGQNPERDTNTDKAKENEKSGMDFDTLNSDSYPCNFCVRLRNGVSSDPYKDPNAANYFKITDSRIEALQLQIRALKAAEKELNGQVSCMKTKVANRDKEIDKLRQYVTLRPGADNVANGQQLSTANASNREMELSLKSAQMQLDLLQKRNINLEKKLKSAILQEHDDIMTGKIRTPAEREFIRHLAELEACEYPTHPEMNMNEKLHQLEIQLSNCCKEKAELKAALEKVRGSSGQVEMGTGEIIQSSPTPEDSLENQPQSQVLSSVVFGDRSSINSILDAEKSGKFVLPSESGPKGGLKERFSNKDGERSGKFILKSESGPKNVVYSDSKKGVEPTRSKFIKNTKTVTSSVRSSVLKSNLKKSKSSKPSHSDNVQVIFRADASKDDNKAQIQGQSPKKRSTIVDSRAASKTSIERTASQKRSKSDLQSFSRGQQSQQQLMDDVENTQQRRSTVKSDPKTTSKTNLTSRTSSKSLQPNLGVIETTQRSKSDFLSYARGQSQQVTDDVDNTQQRRSTAGKVDSKTRASSKATISQTNLTSRSGSRGSQPNTAQTPEAKGSRASNSDFLQQQRTSQSQKNEELEESDLTIQDISESEGNSELDAELDKLPLKKSSRPKAAGALTKSKVSISRVKSQAQVQDTQSENEEQEDSSFAADANSVEGNTGEMSGEEEENEEDGEEEENEEEENNHENNDKQVQYFQIRTNNPFRPNRLPSEIIGKSRFKDEQESRKINSKDRIKRTKSTRDEEELEQQQPQQKTRQKNPSKDSKIVSRKIKVAAVSEEPEIEYIERSSESESNDQVQEENSRISKSKESLALKSSLKQEMNRRREDDKSKTRKSPQKQSKTDDSYQERELNRTNRLETEQREQSPAIFKHQHEKSPPKPKSIDKEKSIISSSSSQGQRKPDSSELLLKENSELHQELAFQSEKLSKMNSECQQHLQELYRLREKPRSQENWEQELELQRLKRQLEASQRDLDFLAKERDDAMEKVSRLSREISIERNKSYQQQQYPTPKSQHSQLPPREEFELQRRLREQLSKEQELERELARLKSNNIVADRNKAELRTELEHKNERLARLTQDCEKYKGELNRLQQTLRSYEYQAPVPGTGSSSSEVQYLKRQVDSLRKELETIRKEKEDAIRDNRRLASFTNKDSFDRNGLGSIDDIYKRTSLERSSSQLLPNARDQFEMARRLRTQAAREQELEDELSRLRSSISKLDRDKDELRVELDRKDERLARLVQDNEKQSAELSRLQLSLKNTEYQLGHSGDAARENEREVSLLKRQIETLRRDLEAVSKEREEALKDARRLASAISKEEIERRSLSQDYEKKNREAEELKKQVAKYIEEVRRIEDLLLQKEEELDNLMEQYRNLTMEKSSLESARSNLENEASSIREDVRETVDQNLVLKNQLKSQNELIISYEQEIERLTLEVTSLENQFGNLSEKEKSGEADSKAARDMLYTMEIKMDKLKLDLANAEGIKAKLEAENQELKVHIDILEEQIEQLLQKEKQLHELLANVREKEFENERSSQDLSTERDQLSDRLKSMQTRTESLNEEVSKFRLKSTELQNELERTKRQLQTEKMERESAITELKRVQEQLNNSSTTSLLNAALNNEGAGAQIQSEVEQNN